MGAEVSWVPVTWHCREQVEQVAAARHRHAHELHDARFQTFGASLRTGIGDQVTIPVIQVAIHSEEEQPSIARGTRMLRLLDLLALILLRGRIACIVRRRQPERLPNCALCAWRHHHGLVPDRPSIHLCYCGHPAPPAPGHKACCECARLPPGPGCSCCSRSLHDPKGFGYGNSPCSNLFQKQVRNQGNACGQLGDLVANNAPFSHQPPNPSHSPPLPRTVDHGAQLVTQKVQLHHLRTILA